MSEFLTCPVCNKEFWSYASQKRKYCSRECSHIGVSGPRSPRITKPCLQCGKPVTVIERKHKLGLGKFCSYSCRSKYYKDENLPPHPIGTEFVERFEILCTHCKKIMRLTQTEIDSGREYCSHHCASKGKIGKPLLALRKPKIKRACQYCGKEFEIYPAWVKKGEGKFCSKECSYKGRKQPQRTEHVQKECRYCGEVIDLMPNQSHQKFCSPNCAYKYRGPTDIEEMLMDELDSRKIIYEPQYQIGRYHIDFAFPESNLAVEADGTYWHSRKGVSAKDRRKNQYLQSQGWTVLRFTGDEIRESPARCVDEIVKLLK